MGGAYLAWSESRGTRILALLALTLANFSNQVRVFNCLYCMCVFVYVCVHVCA